MDTIERSLFVNRIQSICEEMGALLQATAFSPNIRDRLDFSCAIFDKEGQLCAQAAHIPVHLGSMAFAMQSIVKQVDWDDGDLLILNDPFLGGTHLPDITVISPVVINSDIYGFVANRAHHADIGSQTPGSMPLSVSLEEEGLIIPPTFLIRSHNLVTESLDHITSHLSNPASGLADIQSQTSTNHRGLSLFKDLINKTGKESFLQCLKELNDYAETLAKSGISIIPNGHYEFEDVMDDDGINNRPVSIKIKLTVSDQKVIADFSETSGQVTGNINCPLSVTAAAVYYCFYSLMPKETPACAGAFRPIQINAPAGCILNAKRPAAVAAGNVETSTRIVDVVLGALSRAIPELIPAASQGTMNNIAMGAHTWDYYETIAGGLGACALHQGLDAAHSHMTNTLNTPIEVLEMEYPLRVSHYGIRRGSGGRGKYRGGNGIRREYCFLEKATVTLLTERRKFPPWGLAGGDNGDMGQNRVNTRQIGGKTTLILNAGDTLTIDTPGGGGWGEA